MPVYPPDLKDKIENVDSAVEDTVLVNVALLLVIVIGAFINPSTNVLASANPDSVKYNVDPSGTFVVVIVYVKFCPLVITVELTVIAKVGGKNPKTKF